MKIGFYSIVGTLCVSLLIITYTLFTSSLKLESIGEEEFSEEIKVKVPIVKYGLILDSLDEFAYKVKRNQTLDAILSEYSINKETIHKIVAQSASVFHLGNIQAGQNYRVYLGKNEEHPLKCLVYEANPLDHIVIKFTDSASVFREEKKIDTLVRSVGGKITSSLYETLKSQKTSGDLPVDLAKIFAWQVDFFKIMQGDNFKVVYEEVSVEGTPVKCNKILAASFQQNGKTYYAYNFKEDGEDKFFDENGKNVKGAFLKAPLKYFRITSRFAKTRFHPVLKRFKAHLGTDYAAPYGTPILAVGNGVVVDAKYSQYNGNYVKIKHNGTYTTQYLHMSRIAKKMRPGRRVGQGEVIGYVGSTGLATGPHVCFRFWKSGVQIDPRSVKVLNSDPVKKNNKDAFEKVKVDLQRKLEDISI